MARNVVPRTNEGASLGTPTKKWDQLHSRKVNAAEVETPLITAELVVSPQLDARFNAKAGRQGLEHRNGTTTIPNSADLVKGDAFTLYWSGVWYSMNSHQPPLIGNTRGVQGYNAGSVGLCVSAGGVLRLINEKTSSAVGTKTGPTINSGVHYDLAATLNTVTRQLYFCVNGVQYDGGVFDYLVITSNLDLRLCRGDTGGRYVNADVSDAGVLNYVVPATTTDGIKGVAERYRDGRFLTKEDLSEAKAYVASAFSFVKATDNGTSSVSRFDFTTTTGTNNFQSFTQEIGAIKIGDVFRVNISGYSISSGTATIEIRRLESAGVTLEQVTITGDGDYIMVAGNFAATGATVRIRNSTSGVSIQGDITFERLGATLALESEGIQAERGQWLDSSANKLHALQSETGTKPILPVLDAELNWKTTNAGSFWVGGSDRAVLPDGHIITGIFVKIASEGNVSVRDADEGSFIVNSALIDENIWYQLPLARAQSVTNKLSLNYDEVADALWKINYKTINE